MRTLMVRLLARVGVLCFLLLGAGACDYVMTIHPELFVLLVLLRFLTALLDFRSAGIKYAGGRSKCPGRRLLRWFRLRTGLQILSRGVCLYLRFSVSCACMRACLVFCLCFFWWVRVHKHLDYSGGGYRESQEKEREPTGQALFVLAARTVACTPAS